MNPWIATHSGIAFDFVEPTPEMVNKGDIAHALSNICRYTGHTSGFYSVAEHSCCVAQLLLRAGHEREICYAGLWHDATEAYLSDISAPLKSLLPDYQAMEDKVWRQAICPALGLPEVLPEQVKKADLTMLATERRYLMGPCERSWPVGIRPDLGIRIRHMDPYTAYRRMMSLDHFLSHADKQKEFNDYRDSTLERLVICAG